MNRRNKARLDLQLLCRVDGNSLLSAPVGGLTENVSRGGMLMRWIEAVPLPKIGCRLTVDVELPETSATDRRVMRCRTRVVRIVPGKNTPPSVGLEIENVQFAKAETTFRLQDLEAMPSATTRLI
jgi:c-di-GMP-binding flagellar brake protein YcgR